MWNPGPLKSSLHMSQSNHWNSKSNHATLLGNVLQVFPIPPGIKSKAHSEPGLCLPHRHPLVPLLPLFTVLQLSHHLLLLLKSIKIVPTSTCHACLALAFPLAASCNLQVLVQMSSTSEGSSAALHYPTLFVFLMTLLQLTRTLFKHCVLVDSASSL